MSRDDEIDYRQMYPIPGRTRRSQSRSPARENPEAEPIPERNFARRIKPQKNPTSADHQYEPDRPRQKLTISVKEMLARTPGITLANMKRELDELGYRVSDQTLGTLRQDFYETIRIAEKAGYIRLLR